jgi:hypothetical protein
MLGLLTAPSSLYNTEATGIPSLGMRSADEELLISWSETKIKKKCIYMTVLREMGFFFVRERDI